MSLLTRDHDPIFSFSKIFVIYLEFGKKKVKYQQAMWVIINMILIN
jgi:hypothetical protein